jgi:hypothetical protein
VVHDQQVIDTLTVPTKKSKTRNGNPPSSATRTTRHTLHIGKASDGQHIYPRAGVASGADSRRKRAAPCAIAEE